MTGGSDDAWWQQQTARATKWVLAEDPCTCGHQEDRHLSLATSNRCPDCGCEGYEPAKDGQ